MKFNSLIKTIFRIIDQTTFEIIQAFFVYIDLAFALIKNKVIGGAGIDVTSEEPPKIKHAYYRIINYPNFIWTPHTAWASNETLQFAINQLLENINSFYKGKKRNIL